MAVKNTNLGGTDWAFKDNLESQDLNDTFNALTEKIQTLSAFWLNPDLSQPYLDLSTQTLDESLNFSLSPVSGTIENDNGASNPDNFFDGNPATAATMPSTTAQTTRYLGKVFPPKFVWVVSYLASHSDSTFSRTFTVQVLKSGTWVTVRSNGLSSGTFKGEAWINDTIEGVRMAINSVNSSQSTTLNYLSLVETPTPLIPLFENNSGRNGNSDLRIQERTIGTQTIRVSEGTLNVLSRNFGSATLNTLYPIDTNRHFFLIANLNVTSTTNTTSTTSILISTTTAASVSSANVNASASRTVSVLGVRKLNDTYDIYVDGLFFVNLPAEGLIINSRTMGTGGTGTPSGNARISTIQLSKSTVQ